MSLKSELWWQDAQNASVEHNTARCILLASLLIIFK